ncbi:30S ribosomal protein S6 [Candidatus Nomurabacteria bacterium]|nr:30S ribosomal protein S6 [Candidatus Nomurabacteria bacterium]
MAENTMPAVEVEEVELDSKESQSYELAFHVLPTIAEGEVNTVFGAIKDLIKKEGGEIFDEEAPERFELAYEVIKHLESKNRRFNSAYFGWVRFKAMPQDTVRINAEIEHNVSILRHLLIKLSRLEEENPFRFHDAIRDLKMVTDIEETDVSSDEAPASEETKVEDTEVEEEDDKTNDEKSA